MKKDETSNLHKTVGFRLSPAEFKAVQKACDAQSRTISNLLRLFALDGLKAGGYLPGTKL